MTPDRYTKAVLTVIALCLVWLCVAVSGPVLIPEVAAQSAGEVVIVGWRDANGRTWTLPATTTLPGENNQFSRTEREREVARIRSQGLRLPVDGD